MENEKYLSIFIEESGDHLKEMSECASQISDGNMNPETVNEMFRAVHTLKGMAGTMGFNKMQTLFHSMEDLLSLLKKQSTLKESPELSGDSGDAGTSELSESSELLLEGTDLAEELLESVSEGTYSDSFAQEEKSLIDRLHKASFIQEGNGESALSEEKSLTESHVLNPELSSEREEENLSIDVFSLDQKTAGYIITDEYGGSFSYVVRVTLEKNCILRPARCFMVFREFEENGKVYKTVPSEKDIMDDHMDGSFTVLFVTEKKIQEISQKIKNITDVEECTWKQVSVRDTVNEKNSGKTEKNEKKTPSHVPMLRISVENIDSFMNMVNDLVMVKNSIINRYEYLAGINHHVPTYSDNLEKLDSISNNMSRMMNFIRMAPVAPVFDMCGRTVRKLSRELKKNIRLHVSGEDTELDRTIVDELSEPLLHLIRNSADHGIETPDERKKLGKTPEGNIYLNAYRTANSVFIEVIDDGHGIDIEAVKTAAVKKGLFSEKEAEKKSSSELLSLIFLPGFSTSEKVTDISGRGVGLDAVDAMVKKTGGYIKCNTELFKGSSFSIRYPLSMSLVSVLRITTGGIDYAVPVNNVKSIETVKDSNIKRKGGSFFLETEFTSCPIIPDSNKHSRNEDGEYSAIVITNGREKAALIIDSLGHQQDILVKPLDSSVSHSPEIGGAAIASDGTVVLVLEISTFFERQG